MSLSDNKYCFSKGSVQTLTLLSQAVLYCVTEALAWFEFYTAARSQDLVPCITCGRCFAQDVLLRHDPICKKVFNKKRKPFNSLKQRLQGTEITTVKKQPPQKTQPGKKSNWRQYHEDFINTIKSAKQFTKALKEGQPLPPPPPPSINPDYIQCPHCSRRFNEAAAQRHIKFCEEQAACRAFAAKTTRHTLGKQPVTQRKPPTLTTAVLPLQKREQEGANTDELRPETSPGILQKTRKSLGVSTGKKSSGKFGKCNYRDWNGVLKRSTLKFC
ncbi:zinc finger C2HC domain-containing protein 1B [Balearica regulorum gibbericeps]|uniref:zinc finger C2HC domain-containing protein 1B n=1 Tax=Balearica regulorum gibbericeps TaxID=100784 RepID=UPI003F644006